jgi:hypothetical protein
MMHQEDCSSEEDGHQFVAVEQNWLIQRSARNLLYSSLYPQRTAIAGPHLAIHLQLFDRPHLSPRQQQHAAAHLERPCLQLAAHRHLAMLSARHIVHRHSQRHVWQQQASKQGT